MGPSVPLSSHPVLRKSQSTTDLDKSTEEDRPLRPVSQQPPRQGQEGPRPKNRAPPPPPPGKRKEREKTQESATDDARPPGKGLRRLSLISLISCRGGLSSNVGLISPVSPKCLHVTRETRVEM